MARYGLTRLVILALATTIARFFSFFQVFRRSSPKPRIAGAWARLLIVKENDRAEQMAKKFHAGDSEYQEDTKWWELVEEEDLKLLTDTTTEGGGDQDDDLGDFTDNEESDDSGADVAEPKQDVRPPVREPLMSLSREYRHDRSNQSWDVQAWQVEQSDPELDDEVGPLAAEGNYG